MKYETSDVIDDVLGEYRFQGYCVGIVLDSVMEYPNTKDEIKTLKTAEQHLNNLIESLKKDSQTIDLDNKNINSPSHYTQGKYETIDVVRDVLGPEKFEGHCVGNILKYVFRYPYKNGIEDLKKAEKYLEWLIETKEEQQKEGIS